MINTINLYSVLGGAINKSKAGTRGRNTCGEACSFKGLVRIGAKPKGGRWGYLQGEHPRKGNPQAKGRRQGEQQGGQRITEEVPVSPQLGGKSPESELH